MAKKVEVAAIEPVVTEAVKPGKRMSVLFHERKFALIQELQPQLATNNAWVKNIFPVRIAALIESLQGQIKFETRMGDRGPFEFAQVEFSDGSTANMPTLRALEQTVQKNEWAHNIQRHLMKDFGVDEVTGK